MKRERMEDALLEMGIPASIKGFKYIVDAVEIIDDVGMAGMTKWIYPEIAKKNQTTPGRVERNIRSALERVRTKFSDYEAVERYISFSDCTNSASLYRLHMILKREEKEGKK